LPYLTKKYIKIKGTTQSNCAKEFNQGVAAFHGLSPDGMHQLLYQPFNSPSVISFNTSTLHELSQV